MILMMIQTVTSMITMAGMPSIQTGLIPGTGSGASHGTHVAGIVGAVSNNENQVAGINWDVQLVIGWWQFQHLHRPGGLWLCHRSETCLDWSPDAGGRRHIVATNSSFGIDYADCESGDYPLWNETYNAMGELGILSAAATSNGNVNVDEQGDVPTSCSAPI